MAYYPKTAMVFAAGLGTRMRHLTSDKPKPMVEVNGKPLIDWRLDELKAYGIERVIVNTHYKAEIIEQYLQNRKDLNIIISHEDERLETGGGILNCFELLGEEPVFVMNSDVIFLDKGQKQCSANALNLLADNYDRNKMKLLISLHEVERAIGYHGNGDFDAVRENDGLLELQRGEASSKKKYVYSGTHILDTLQVKEYAEKTGKKFFSLAEIFNENMRDKLYGVDFKGEWLHVDSPESLKEAEDFLSNQ